jgi:hypothetical protein
VEARRSAAGLGGRLTNLPGGRLSDFAVVTDMSRGTHARAEGRGLAKAASRPVRRRVPRLAFNQQEAAEALGISVDHFERHIKSDLPVVYSGSLRLYPRKVLERWLDEHSIRGGTGVA